MYPIHMKQASRFSKLKQDGIKISMLTCYDYPSAKIQDACGIDIIFVGDSLATNVLGYAHQNDLNLQEMRHHVRAVARGIEHAYLLADIPYAASRDLTSIMDATEQLRQDGVDGVKVEGFKPDVFKALAASAVDGWAHLGFTPQLIEKPSMQAKDSESAEQLVAECIQLEAAGAVGIILELVPTAVAQRVSQSLNIPVIGIGAGLNCDGQVQVWHDLIGLETRVYKHAFRQCDAHAAQTQAVKAYIRLIADAASDEA
ncbi:3-methyl-2-oxobutanoate hydroxymethyltransferase [Coraliomargarita sp. SDUM461004]|uniref:3-methyl-2-oxobutanoate hydroxymethyltransferase n=1 Tax=Thalassobacterium sedimentorum TaxID=3041258 RepID=A0ABU1AMJ2_9BACT|nr:3-methyl-2-oxobutanoate hydroxymethyltransferase [Coraliomargarita sp. SDUM461004]MDQ8195959.1 3-methyl-2-oxobutanoate hydroxymethyltransferase [Coraliomargarita sp. SDUM461004]